MNGASDRRATAETTIYSDQQRCLFAQSGAASMDAQCQQHTQPHICSILGVHTIVVHEIFHSIAPHGRCACALCDRVRESDRMCSICDYNIYMCPSRTSGRRPGVRHRRPAAAYRRVALVHVPGVVPVAVLLFLGCGGGGGGVRGRWGGVLAGDGQQRRVLPADGQLDDLQEETIRPLTAMGKQERSPTDGDGQARSCAGASPLKNCFQAAAAVGLHIHSIFDWKTASPNKRRARAHDPVQNGASAVRLVPVGKLPGSCPPCRKWKRRRILQATLWRLG